MTRRLSSKKKRLIVASIAVVLALGSHALYESVRGQELAKTNLIVDGESFQICIRQRCTGSFIDFVLLHYILRSGLASYEYWAEAFQDGKRVATSSRWHASSFSSKSVAVGATDREGVTFVFSRSNSPKVTWMHPLP